MTDQTASVVPKKKRNLVKAKEFFEQLAKIAQKFGTNQELSKSSCEKCKENQNSTVNIAELQVNNSEELAELIQKLCDETRLELLEELREKQILNYSSYDDVYFVEKNGIIFFISQKSSII